MSTTEITQVAEVAELTDGELIALFGPTAKALNERTVATFVADLSYGSELTALCEEHGVTGRRVSDVCDIDQTFVSRSMRCVALIAEWDGALGKRQTVAKHGLIAVYSKGRSRLSLSGLIKFVDAMVEFSAPAPAKLTGAKLIDAKVVEARKALDRVLAGLTPAQTAKVMVALLGE